MKVLVISTLAISLAITGSLALPTLFKGSESNQVDKVQNDLEKLQSDGISVQKSVHQESKLVNGQPIEAVETKETAILDPKTGKIVASVSAASEKKPGKPAITETHLDVPSAGVHKTAISEVEAEKDLLETLLPPEVAAQYIFETSDVDGVKQSITDMVKMKRLNQQQADSYFDQVKESLNELHENALHQMQMEKRKSAGMSSAFKDMIEMVDTLSKDNEVKESLYSYVKTFYTLYFTEGDEAAKTALNDFADLVKAAAEEDQISDALQEEIYGIILQAMSDVRSEYQARVKEENSQEPADTEVRELERMSEGKTKQAQDKH